MSKNIEKKIDLTNLKLINSYSDRKDKKYKDYKICFADIESKLKNDIQELICICIIFDNEEVCFQKIEDFFKYTLFNLNKSVIYLHNMGRFDCMFLLNYLVKNDYIGNIDIIERNNVIYQITLKKYNIVIKDSYLITNMSLKNLGINFCKEYQKNLEFKYNEIQNIEFEKIKEHCIRDCKVLKEGFMVFRFIILEKFSIDIYNELTLSSLSFNIFKKIYYNKNMTPITKNAYKEDQFIRKSYKGGIAEVYIPYLENGYCYDVNSLYPTVMMNEKYPIGKGEFVEGNTIDLENFIGFIECEIFTDKDLNFLTYKHPIRGLITPKGQWKDVYYYKEIIKAIELGYQVKFIKGFKYEREAKIFDKFVKELYEMRVNTTSKEVNQVIKLILNSLYGRFGMKTIVNSTKYIKGNKIQEYKKDYNINNIIYLGNDTYIINGMKKLKDNKDMYSKTIDTETAVQIASCITAYARLFMYEFKNIPNNKCYYTDTDSIFLEKKLDKKYLGNELGKFKLEYEINKAYFIAPKVYYIEKFDNEKKIVMKGVKKEEYNNYDIKNIFEQIINNNNYVNLIVNRINYFKRLFIKMLIGKVSMNIKISFVFNKRKKIIVNNKWVATESIDIKD